MMYDPIQPRNPCPICGKPHGAVMGSNQWRHDLFCCSQECGERARDIIVKNMASPEYKKECKAAERANDRAYQIKMRGIGNQ